MRPVSLSGRAWLMAGGVALLLAAILFLAGRWQGRSQAEGAHDALQAQVAAMTQERDGARAELAAERARVEMLLAQSLLFETALDLEQRNFGTANERMDAAAEHLRTVGEAATSGPLGTLRDEIAATDLRVAADLAGQRARVLEFATRLDQLLTNPAASAAVIPAPAPTEPAAPAANE